VAKKDVETVLAAYPKIYFACHTRHVFDPKTRETISAHQAGILGHLDTEEPLKLTALAEHMGVTLATMSLGVKRLVERGFVRQERNPDDRRCVQLRLTGAGAHLKEANSVLDPERVARLLARLSPGEQRAALYGLSLLAHSAQTEIGTWTRERAKGSAP
jgi:DNA-binding MarR family transcriptional regulator